MSKEREDFEDWLRRHAHHNAANLYPPDEIPESAIKLSMRMAYGAGSEGERRHYQPLLEEKDAEIEKLRLKIAEMREELAADTRLITGFEAGLDAKDAEIAARVADMRQAEKMAMSSHKALTLEAEKNEVLQDENTTLKALLEQAREGLEKAVKRQGFTNEELINARGTLAAINAATGEK